MLDIKGEQIAREAEQDVSRVSVRMAGERTAWKNERLFWRRREIGMHALNVLFDRKEFRNAGHEEAVKLLPIEVSNGCGREVAVYVAVADVDVDDAVLVKVEFCEERVADDLGADAILDTLEVVLVLELSLFLNVLSMGEGGGRLSMCIKLSFAS